MKGLKEKVLELKVLLFNDWPVDVTQTGQTHGENPGFWACVHQNYCLCGLLHLLTKTTVSGFCQSPECMLRIPCRLARGLQRK
jgi:hypothetical protein